MNLTQNDGEPTKFLQELKEKSSLLLFYEEPRYAKSLGFLFLDMGLKSSQLCLYISCEPVQNIEKDMIVFGINVTNFKNNNRLRIHSTANHGKDQVTAIIEDFMAGAKNHTARIIIQRDRFSREQQRELLIIEEFVQALFEKHDVSVLHIYNTEFMDNAKFMQQIINMHNYTIFAPDFGKGIVIKTK